MLTPQTTTPTTTTTTTTTVRSRDFLKDCSNGTADHNYTYDDYRKRYEYSRKETILTVTDNV